MALTNEQLRASQFLESLYAKASATGNADNLVRWIDPDATTNKYYVHLRDSILAETIQDSSLSGNVVDSRRKYYLAQLGLCLPTVEAAARTEALAILIQQGIKVGFFLDDVRSRATDLHFAARKVQNYVKEVKIPFMSAAEMKEISGQSGGSGTVPVRLKRMTYMNAVRNGGNQCLFRLMAHPKGVQIVDQFAKSAADGSTYATEVLNECANAIGGLWADLGNGTTSVWRFPPAVAIGCANLRISPLTKFWLTWAKTKKSKLESALDMAGNAIFAFDLIGGPQAKAVGAMLTFILAAIGTAVSFLRDFEQDQAAKATAFAGNVEKLSEGSRSAGTILQGAATIVAALAVPGALSKITGSAGKAGVKLASEVERVPPVREAPDPRAVSRRGVEEEAVRTADRGVAGKGAKIASPGVESKIDTAPPVKASGEVRSIREDAVTAEDRAADEARRGTAGQRNTGLLNRGTALVPELAAGFTAIQVQGFKRLLAKPLTSDDISVFGRIWRKVGKPSDVARLTLENSRDLFNLQRRRFWNAVRANPEAVAILRDAGLVFRGGPTTVPVWIGPTGTEILMNIDHIAERQTAWSRALDPSNLRIVFERENTVVLRLVNQLDPFQSPLYVNKHASELFE